MNIIKELEEKQQSVKKELLALKREELARLNREFNFDDYERRYNVSRERLTSALIGEDLSNEDLSKLKKENKV